MDIYKQRGQQNFKSQSERRARYVVNLFKNDELPMQIFSYLWTHSQAHKRLKELNSRAKAILQNAQDFEIRYGSLFIQLEYSKPAPTYDVEFDDYADLEFYQYKDIHIHAIDVYTMKPGGYLGGLEIQYLVDGDLLKYVLHYKTLRNTGGIKGSMNKGL